MTCNDCNLGQNPDLVPEKSINILPAAPLLSCSLSVKEERSEEEALFGLTKGDTNMCKKQLAYYDIVGGAR